MIKHLVVLSTRTAGCSMDMISLFWNERPQFCDIFFSWQENFTSPRNWARVPKLPVTQTLHYRCLNYTAMTAELLKWNVECTVFWLIYSRITKSGLSYLLTTVLQFETWRTVNGIILNGRTSVQWQTANNVSAVNALSLFMPMMNYFDAGQEIKPPKNLCLS
jgi:hypothetical protein